MIRLVVLGDLNLDVCARLSGPMLRDGELRASVRATPGGSAGNVARAAARDGAQVVFVGSVGTDAVGDLLIGSLTDLGIEARVRRVAEPSGIVLSLERDSGKTMVCSRGANDGLDESFIDDTLFDGVDHLHVSGYALLSLTQRPVARAAMGMARRVGLTVSVGLPPANLIHEAGAKWLLEELTDATLVFLNHAEGAILTGHETPPQIVDALAQRFSTGVLTLGEAGAVAWDGPARDRRSGQRLAGVDPTGAGDAFAGGFLTSYLTDRDLARANARGEAAAVAFLRSVR